MTKYIRKEQIEKLQQQFPNLVFDAEQEKPAVYVQADELLAVLQYNLYGSSSRRTLPVPFETTLHWPVPALAFSHIHAPQNC